MQNSNEKWIEQIRKFCIDYNIPLEYLSDILSEPKVIPMIRGKAFEFSTMLLLQNILPESEWIVDKPVMNAQFGFHDMDVRIIHKATQKTIRIECKLAAKGSFQILKNGDAQIKVKCMRSRTLGDSKVKELAPKIGVSEALLKIHNDQYIPSDFDVVITSIANSFYTTNEDTDSFDWNPNEKGRFFLNLLSGVNDIKQLQSFAYSQLYLAHSSDLAILSKNNHKCTRKTCPIPDNCGFIPNYPVITFLPNATVPKQTWHPLKDALSFFNSIIEKI
jgi:hypothetical protein